jgi:ketosteroid isomerase-like protein
MPLSPPPTISDYLTAAAGGDAAAAAACFTDDAVVFDEDKEWRGRAEIKRWRDTLASAYEYTVEVRGAAALGEADGIERHEVHVRLVGNFPGGTVDLTYAFALRDGGIARLEIVPTKVSDT